MMSQPVGALTLMVLGLLLGLGMLPPICHTTSRVRKSKLTTNALGWSWTICLSGLIGILQGPAAAQAAHTHCLELDWSTTATATNPPVPADYRPGGNSANLGFFAFVFQLPAAPPSGDPDCIYEISDITEITLSFTVQNGPMVWQTLRVGLDPTDPKDPGRDINGPFNLAGIGFGTLIQTFPAHDAPGAYELDLSKKFVNFPVSLRMRVPPNDAFVITAASGEIKGHHYYVVPEPSTILMGAMGVGITALRRRPRWGQASAIRIRP